MKEKLTLNGFIKWFLNTGKYIIAIGIWVLSIAGIIFSAHKSDSDGVKAGILFLSLSSAGLISGYFFDVWNKNKFDK